MEAAITHHEKAIRVASSLGLKESQASTLRCLVELLLGEGRLNDAQPHLESPKSVADSSLFNLGLRMVMQVCVWRRQGRFEEAESEVSRVMDMCRKLGVPADSLEHWKGFLQEVEEKVNNLGTSG